MPLGPRWKDYTYREGDSFYGGKATTGTEPSVVNELALPANPDSAAALLHGSLRVVSGALSKLKSSIISTVRARPVQPRVAGFQVVRPSRVPPESGDQIE